MSRAEGGERIERPMPAKLFAPLNKLRVIPLLPGSSGGPNACPRLEHA